MTYSKACEIMGYNESRDPAYNAQRAEGFLSRRVVGSPLRYAVACDVIIAYAS